jgi:three-Cys-motif partner protein
MVAAVPKNSLCMAYVDPYNLELLSYELLKKLARLPKVDLAINFCTMDLKRNGDLEFDPDRARFDAAAPGWRAQDAIRNCSKSNIPVEFFAYWCDLVKRLGFSTSKEMPLVRNDQGHPIYRMVFFARHDLSTGFGQMLQRAEIAHSIFDLDRFT